MTRRCGFAGAHWIRPMQCGLQGLRQCHRRQLRMSCLWGSRRIALHKADTYRLVNPVHCFHLKVGSGFRMPDMPLYLVSPCKTTFTQDIIVVIPTRHTPHVYLSNFWSTSSYSVDTRTLFFLMLTGKAFPNIINFQRISFFCDSSSDADQAICIQVFTATTYTNLLGVCLMYLHSGCEQHALCFPHFAECLRNVFVGDLSISQHILQENTLITDY